MHKEDTMTGLFGGGGGQVTYVPTTPTNQASQDANKGATDLEKMKQKNERRKSYGSQTSGSFSADNALASDTTLSSGSLLSLGGTLG